MPSHWRRQRWLSLAYSGRLTLWLGSHCWLGAGEEPMNGDPPGVVVREYRDVVEQLDRAGASLTQARTRKSS